MFEVIAYEEYQVPESFLNAAATPEENSQLLRELLIGEILTPNQEAVLRMLYEGPVRVYETNSPLTMDYCPTRLNIELNSERCIVEVFFG